MSHRSPLSQLVHVIPLASNLLSINGVASQSRSDVSHKYKPAFTDTRNAVALPSGLDNPEPCTCLKKQGDVQAGTVKGRPSWNSEEHLSWNGEGTPKLVQHRMLYKFCRNPERRKHQDGSPA
ncbi:putative xyloglucan endotransglucosylase/hydrolase protein 26 [Dorcoceras hygrometricum]|uniref:Putative xyloglucan endotransglucosylase/hydrolase protein 26 n=1 Tax=Dorcoceras hygrometricum TaxID=472368 RepID=A0A2Z7ACW3_9LAMI|nr:putative xyloglucan endotransglucosylase/hydrolase protein 26 [Dorcoceras hygrometricum]